MATIRTQLVSGQRRIITKVVDGQRRVSCSCCAEPECCMYPAQSLTDGLITIADLPDNLVMYVSINGELFGPEIVEYNQDGTYGVEQGPYVQLSGPGDEWIATWKQIDPSFLCLVSSLEADDPPLVLPFDVGKVWIFDNFEDTYKITTSEDGFITEFIVTRCGLCVWADNCDPENRLATLRFLDGQRANPLLPNVKPEWEVQAAGQVGIKIGPLNTPVGSYSANIGTIEVSAA